MYTHNAHRMAVEFIGHQPAFSYNPKKKGGGGDHDHLLNQERMRFSSSENMVWTTSLLSSQLKIFPGPPT